jgi:protein phosphatase
VKKVEITDTVNSAKAEPMRQWNDKRDEPGPFDIIGDVHGCCDELETLLQQLGYQIQETQPPDLLWGNHVYVHPESRRAVFLGDIVDRGPRVIDALRIVRNMVQAGSAFCVPGNHDIKLRRKLSGKNVQITHGLQQSLAEIEGLPPDIRELLVKEASEFIDGLISHYVFDNGKLVVAHAGMKEEMQGRDSGKVRNFALFGETTGETDKFGLPVRYNWAAEYQGQAIVVYGHTPVPEPEWLNRTINIDTGCVFGGKLTALRYPEKEILSVPAAGVYCIPSRPFLPISNRD